MPLPERHLVDVTCRVCGAVRRISKYEVTDICLACRVKQPRPYQIRDLTGQVFGKLTAVSLDGRIRRGAAWLCRCECGNFKTVSTIHLRSGGTVSCGCHRSRQGRLSSLPEYKCWKAMMSRCYHAHNEYYHYYGGRGISVAERWHSFPLFLEDMGPRPNPSLTLDRIDVNGDYEPGNCRWATWLQQQRNRRGQRKLEMNGVAKLLSEWCAEYGLTRHTVSRRLSKGWGMEQSLTTPSRKSSKR